MPQPVTNVFFAGSGTRSASSVTRVVVRSVIAWAQDLCCGWPTTELTRVSSTSGSASTPRLLFMIRIRRTLASMRSSDSRPDRTASITAWICSAGCCGSSSTSAPASTARMAISASPYISRTPSIRSESVAITPVNFSSSRSTPVSTLWLRVDGSPDRRTRGRMMCAVMIASTPALMAARNGGASIFSHCSRVWVIIGSA